MIRLSKGQVVLLHKRLIETTGGSNGIRDDGIPQIGCRTSGGCPFCTDRSGAETLKLQRYRKHKEEWLIWLLFQSFARRQSEDASSLLVSI